MKKYIKNKEVKSANRIVIIKDGMQIFNPSEELILADGWEEYIPPVVSTEPTLDDVKREKINNILEYDSSSEVNEFSINDIPVWLDKATRVGLELRFRAEQAQGFTTTTLWYESMQFSLSIEQAIQMLYAIELYASACYDNTQRHLATVGNMTTKEEVENYDYKVGYPEKLRF